MGLSRWKMARSFLLPTLISFALLFLCFKLIHIDAYSFDGMNIRLAYILVCLIKTACWIIPYFGCLLLSGQLKLSEFKELKPASRV